MYLKSSKKNKIGLMDNLKFINVENNFLGTYMPFYFLIIIIFSLIFVNLFKLQIVEGNDYLVIASRVNRQRTELNPPRGLIYDQNYKQLAYNLPAYRLYVNPQNLSNEEEELIISTLSGLFNFDKQSMLDAYNRQVYEGDQKLNISNVTIISDLDIEKYIDGISVISNLPGVHVETDVKRFYPGGKYYSHILGYIGDPTQLDVEKGISARSQIGKTGIEYQYDSELRGKAGIQIREKNILGGEWREYVPQDMQYGDNVILTIDSRWQEKLTDILQQQIDEINAFGGAAIIMNSDTGEIKSLVSLPTYDNNNFVNGISYTEYNQLIKDIRTPLLNRAIGLQLPPGSVYKLIPALAGLEEGIITSSTNIMSDRCMTLPGDIKFCEADRGYLGNVNLRDAISKSSNIYFCELALRLNKQRQGIYSLIKYSDAMGIGNLTGIDLIGEQKGTVPSPEFKKARFNEPWYIGDECNTVIGQGLLTVTPIQMLVATASINNGGKLLTPYLLDKVENHYGEIVFQNESNIKGSLDVSQSSLDIIKKGMRDTVLTGTASGLKSSPGNIIAKTGSSDAAELIQGKLYKGAHSWLTGCFEYENDNYCFVVMQQWGGRGYKTVPVMKKLINCIYNDFQSNCEN
jgi:penicillin-binding protein 2